MNSINLKSNSVYNESEIISLIREANPAVSDVKTKWMLFDLERNHSITRIGSRKYITDAKLYSYMPCELSENIDSFLSENYPDVKYVIWESKQLNEWMNFLLSKNIIFVEVESDLTEYIFSSLMEHLGQEYMILINPDNKMVSRYMRDNLVIIKSLYSRAPTDKKGHGITLEKLIVDVISDRLLTSMIGTNDRDEIIKGIVKNYTINETKALAYAKRRQCETEIKRALEGKYD